jgi:hypothetical protein
MRSRHVTRWWAAALVCAAAVTGGAAAKETGGSNASAGSGAARTAPRPRLPQRLSETGLYRDMTRLVVDARNVSYTPQYPLWSDGAAKRRWLRLPDGQAIDAALIDAWEFPVGTRFWKEFSFNGRRVETRVLLKVAAVRWEFASYVWNDAQSDATRAPAGGVANAVEIAPGKWHSIPSVDECRACHDSNRTEPLGFTALQLSDDRDPLAVHGETPDAEAATFRHLIERGLLRNVPPERRGTDPVIPASSPRERAALGYLLANCGACHNTVGPLASLGLSFRQPAYGGGLGVVQASLVRRTKWDRPGAPPESTRVVDLDAPDLSALLIRMKSRRPTSQMPPLGTVVPDHDALAVISGWVLDELAKSRPRAVADASDTSGRRRP